MLRHLSACLTWAIDRGLIERHAAIAIRPPVQRVTRERVLSEAEMEAVWSATESHGDGQADVSYFPILRLLLLTGQRREEVGAMRWAELDLDRGVWQLPGTRTKNGLPHEVPLPQQASEILSGRSGRSRVRVRLSDAGICEMESQQATARPEVRRLRLNGARPRNRAKCEQEAGRAAALGRSREQIVNVETAANVVSTIVKTRMSRVVPGTTHAIPEFDVPDVLLRRCSKSSESR